MIGRTILHYSIIKKLGEGGMGMVYLAEDKRLHRKVALKFLPEYIIDDQQFRDRFYNEARVAASFSHPNIAQIYAIEDSADGIFIVMEYIEGQELREHIKEPTISLDKKLNIARQTAQGLLTAHQKGIIHRDVKSGNIMITTEGNVKIMDFGLALRTGSDRITRHGETQGTASYMAPEQILGDEVDERSDIWSFGVVLYELLTGELPFRGMYEQAVTYAILHDYPKTISGSVPDHLIKIIDRCLEKNPDKRYRSFEELISDLYEPESAYLNKEFKQVNSGKDIKGTKNNYLYSGALFLTVIIAGLWLVARTPPAGGESDIKTHKRLALAVVPFKNIGDENQIYFANGMADMLNTNLAQVDGFRAISQNSVAHYLRSYPLPQMVQELGLDYLIEGSVQLFNERVRINIQLMNARTSEYIWTNSYEKNMGDALIMQKEIAQDILQKIQNALGGGDALVLEVDASQVHPEALRLYLKGVEKQKEKHFAAYLESIRFFEQSIAWDSSFSIAHSRLASSYGFASLFDPAKRLQYRVKARKSIDKALELSPNSSWAYLALGLLSEFSLKWNEAEEAYRRAIELNFANDEAHHELAHHLMRLGRFREALESERRALYFAPHLADFQSGLGEIYMYSRQYEKAIPELEKALEIDPGHVVTYMWLTQAYLYNKNYQKALECASKFSTPESFGYEAQIYAAMGQKEKAIRIIEQQLEKFDPEEVTGGYSYGLMFAYTSLHDHENAIYWLKKTYELGVGWLMYLKVEPGLDPLRDDPRYQAIERTIFEG